MSGSATIKPTISSVTVSRLQQAFKLALSMVLLYWLALWMNWDMPKYGALAIALISLDTTGASLQKGLMRIGGTTVGLIVGMVGLALFAQDSWLTLVYHASYLIFIGYFMQTSRYPYAWYVAGFLPSLVWATTYGKVDNVFHYAVFRYLETTAGIVIYTMIGTVFWPRQAGTRLAQQGAGFCAGLRQLLGYHRQQLADGISPTEATELRNRLAGNLPQMLATLQAAYADTPSVVANKRAWEVFRVNVRALSDAMELWRESINDCRRLNLDSLLPQVGSALEQLDRRLARIDTLWQILSVGEKSPDTEDGSLLESLRIRVSHDSSAGLSYLDRAALQSFVQQLNTLDVTSRELLRTMHVLVGLTPVRDLQSQALPPDLYQPTRWDATRLINGLLPAVCFVAAYFFWIYFDPPTGPSVPNMAATFGLSIVLAPMNALALIPILLVAIWAFVAPVYFFVMPQLDTGFKLLTLVFAFTFVASLFRGRLAAFKTMTLVMFVMMTGISNQQSYSFIGLVDAALMILLALGIIAIVQTLLSPLRPEQILVSNVRRFFRGCARVTDEFAIVSPASRAKGRRLRKRYFESMVLPAPAKIGAAQKRLDTKQQQDNPPETIQRLLEGLQSIVYRLQALEIAHDRISHHSPEVTELCVSLGSQVRETLRQVFEGWASLKPCAALEQLPGLQHISRDMRQQFDALESGQASYSKSELADLYAVLGSVRGLVEAMSTTQKAMNQINWVQLSSSRF